LESIEKIEEAQNQIKKEKEIVLPAVSVADVHTQLQRSPLYEIVQ
jgi:hypothetical protein